MSVGSETSTRSSKRSKLAYGSHLFLPEINSITYSPSPGLIVSKIGMNGCTTEDSPMHVQSMPMPCYIDGKASFTHTMTDMFTTRDPWLYSIDGTFRYLASLPRRPRFLTAQSHSSQSSLVATQTIVHQHRGLLISPLPDEFSR